MKNRLTILLLLNYIVFWTINASAFLDITESKIIKNTAQEVVPGCIDPTACNYDSTATEDNGNCTYNCISPLVQCPEDTEIYLCVPNTTPPALELIDFIPSGNTSLAESLLFNPEQSDGVNPNFTLTIYSYVIEDSRGNQRACIQRYYNTNKPIDGPEIATEIDLCEGELWSFIRKPFLDNYRFYSDDKGTPDELLRVCQFPYSVCSTANFGLNTTKAGTHKFWVTSFIRFTETEICESLPVLITVNVRANPSVELAEQNKILQVGEYLNLREMVIGDKSGIWRGDELISFSIPNGDTWYFFSSKDVGTRKLYYTVGNEFCSKTYVLVVKVVSSSNNNAISRLSSDSFDQFKMYPNPSNGRVFLDISATSSEKHTFKVMDVYGKVNYIKEMLVSLDEFVELDLNHLPKGIYFVEHNNGIRSDMHKLVLK